MVFLFSASCILIKYSFRLESRGLSYRDRFSPDAHMQFCHIRLNRNFFRHRPLLLRRVGVLGDLIASALLWLGYVDRHYVWVVRCHVEIPGKM